MSVNEMIILFIISKWTSEGGQESRENEGEEMQQRATGLTQTLD